MLGYYIKAAGGMEGRIKKEKKEEQKEKSFVLHSYFFRVHVDYLDTHLIRFSFIQHESLPFALHKSECFNLSTGFK